MAVDLTISKTLGGAAVADALAGGGTGVDLGSVVDGSYTPVIDQLSNTGSQALYVRHNAVTDPITNVKTFIAEYSQTYGGDDSAVNDFALLIAKGLASDGSANNATGLSSGFRIEHDADLGNVLGGSAFLASRPQVKIYGDNGTDGISLGSGFDLHVDALIYSVGPVDATTPVTGKIGKSGDAVLGDVAALKLRFYLENDSPDGGVVMWDWAIGYSFTA